MTIQLMKMALYQIFTQALWWTEPNFKSNNTLEYCQRPLLLCPFTCSLHLKVMISCRASKAADGKMQRAPHNLAEILKIHTSKCQFKVVHYWVWWSGFHIMPIMWHQHPNLFALFLARLPAPRTVLLQQACAMCCLLAVVCLTAPALCSAYLHIY